MKRVWRLAAPAALALSLSASPAVATSLGDTPGTDRPSGRAGAVRGISVLPVEGRTEVVIAVDGTVQIRDFTLENPHRVVLDLQNARLGMGTDVYDRVQRGGVRNVRLSQNTGSTVRVVLDLDGRRDYSVMNADGAIRVSITGGESFAAWSSGDAAAPATVTGFQAAVPAAPTYVPEPAYLAEREAPSPTTMRVVLDEKTRQQQSQQRRITVTYEEADIRDVIAAIANQAGRTIIMGKDVSGTVTAEIRDQPWDVALQALLGAQGLAAAEDNNGIITVDSYANILVKQSSEPLVTRLVQVNYVPAATLVETVRSLLSRDCTSLQGTGGSGGAGGAGGNTASLSTQCPTRGQVVADSGTNALLVSEVPSRMGELLNYVRQLDIRTPQVSIKGKLISVNRSATEQLGISYDLGSAQGFSNRLAPRIDDEGQPIPGDFLIELGGNALVGIANADRRYGGTNSALGLIFSTALGKFSLTTFLDALSEMRLSDVQAEPQATTLDNKKARILVGQETPVRVIDYASGGAAGALPRANVQFRETGIILEVTPHITSNRHILLDVYAEQSELTILGGDLGFTIPKRNVRTQVIVRDGETMALGGLTQTQVTKSRSGIPILSDLPLIGRLFSQTETREEKQDLLILLTPHIIDEGTGPVPPGGAR